MADIIVQHPHDQRIYLHYRDLGDGTHAQMTYSQPGYSGAQVHITSGSVANAAAAASIPAVPGKTAYISGFEITGSGATLAAAVRALLTGVLGGPVGYIYGAVAGSLLGNPPLVVQFAQPITASAVNTAITLTLPALGLGNAMAEVVVHGFYL